MLKVTKRSENRIDIEFDGTLDADSMRVALDELIEKSQDIKGGRMFYEIGDFHMPTFGAFVVEFGKLPKLFGLLAKFDKCAVVSDSEWIRKGAEIEGALIPGLKIKSFKSEDRVLADAWLDM